MNKEQYKIMARTPKGVDLIYMTLNDFDSADNILSYLDNLLDESTWLEGWEFWGVYEKNYKENKAEPERGSVKTKVQG